MSKCSISKTNMSGIYSSFFASAHLVTFFPTWFSHHVKCSSRVPQDEPLAGSLFTGACEPTDWTRKLSEALKTTFPTFLSRRTLGKGGHVTDRVSNEPRRVFQRVGSQPVAWLRRVATTWRYLLGIWHDRLHLATLKLNEFLTCFFITESYLWLKFVI